MTDKRTGKKAKKVAVPKGAPGASEPNAQRVIGGLPQRSNGRQAK